MCNTSSSQSPAGSLVIDNLRPKAPGQKWKLERKLIRRLPSRKTRIALMTSLSAKTQHFPTVGDAANQTASFTGADRYLSKSSTTARNSHFLRVIPDISEVNRSHEMEQFSIRLNLLACYFGLIRTGDLLKE